MALAILAGSALRDPRAAAEPPTPSAGELEAGDVLSASNWEAAKELLPPEVLAHYRDGEYRNRVVAWPAEMYTWPSDFLAGIRANVGRYAIGKEGHIVDAATGTQPEYVIGFPFPKIDASDPNAGAKVVWNSLYRWWYFGTVHAETQLNFLGPARVNRRVEVNGKFMYYDGVPDTARAPNPQNFINQSLAVLINPNDVHGTSALTWRYRDPNKRDSVWTYVPALRRVRAVSPSNRSDGFFGSDLIQDDGPFFDGKVEDFEWKLVGERDEFGYVDPLSLDGKSNYEWLGEGKGWRGMWPDLRYIGYMDPAWTGISWAPIGAVLAKRRAYIVEGVPKDRYYLFGKLELHIDSTAFQGFWNRKFSWKGELLNTYQVMAWMPHEVTRPDGTTDFIQGANMAFQCAESLKMNRATIAGVKTAPRSLYDQGVILDAGLFAMDNLSRIGK